VLKTTLMSNGYPKVELGRGNLRLVHRLILEAFVGPCPDGWLTRHLDGDRSRSVLTNLAWGTYEENEADKAIHGTRPIGESHPNATTTEDQVREIRRARATGETYVSIGRRVGVSWFVVQQVWLGRTWTHVV
jgi:hypothetical protein